MLKQTLIALAAMGTLAVSVRAEAHHRHRSGANIVVSIGGGHHGHPYGGYYRPVYYQPVYYQPVYYRYPQYRHRQRGYYYDPYYRPRYRHHRRHHRHHW